MNARLERKLRLLAIVAVSSAAGGVIYVYGRGFTSPAGIASGIVYGVILGLAYLLGHRYADAVRLLEAARARYPSHPLLDFPLAAAYAELGRTDDALDAVRQGRLKNPHFDLASFGSRFQDPALQRRVEESLRKAGLN